MENLEGVSMTELDALVSDNKMQMLKAALPYISATQQQVLSIYVKVLELNNTIQLVHKEESRKVGICSVSEQKRNTTEMLNTIKRYCTDAEKEMIDLFMNFFSAFRMYNTYQELMPKENTKEPRVQKVKYIALGDGGVNEDGEVIYPLPENINLQKFKT